MDKYVGLTSQKSTSPCAIILPLLIVVIKYQRMR